LFAVYLPGKTRNFNTLDTKEVLVQSHAEVWLKLEKLHNRFGWKQVACWGLRHAHQRPSSSKEPTTQREVLVEARGMPN